MWAAFDPDFSDSTIQYGSSSVGLKSWPLKVKSFVFFYTALPVVLPCEVFQETLSPLLIAMARPYPGPTGVNQA